MRRYFAILMATLVLLAGALTAQAVTRSAPRAQAPIATAAADVTGTAAVTTAHPAAATVRAELAVLAAHNAHLAHLKALAWHRAHLAHVAWMAQLAAQQAAAAQNAARIAPVSYSPAPAATMAPASNVGTSAPSYKQTAPSVGSSHASGTYTGSSSFQQCVISRESGGNSQVMNSSGHYGLYQFSASTWAAYGGSPGSFGNASVAQQNQVFANAMAQPGGASNWSPYDGCAYTRAAVTGTAPVHATLMATYSSPGDRLLNAAETRTGDWYSYGAAGPSYFDCSGLVYWAAHQIGISLPRTTYGMPSSGWLYRVYSPRRGDLAFYGTGHVEIMTAWYHTTFGAAHSGTRVGWHVWNSYWAPTAFYRLR